MLICPACEAENEATAATCVSCGKDLLGLGPGSVVANKYEILSLLGKGGMGIVFKARDRQLDEVVALKVLRTDAVITPEMSKRFRAEIKMARKVTHKNVCRIHEYGEAGGLQYISMAFMEGVDLKHVLKEQGALAPAEAYEVAIAVAEGLQAVHDEGIIHRDLKTANIMRDAKGVVRLMDFGIAKQVEEGVHGLTATGMIVGTPEYMSPEQCRGVKVDSRSDIYALGIVVYELFTGRTPFRGDTAITTIIKHLQESPPLEGPEAAGIPAAMIPVLAKALAKNADLRFATAREMAVALANARTQAPPAEATQDDRATTVLPAASDSSLEPTRLTAAKPTVMAQTEAEAQPPEAATYITAAPKAGGVRQALKPEVAKPQVVTPRPVPRPPEQQPLAPGPPPRPRPEGPPDAEPGLAPMVIGLIVLVVAGAGLGGYRYFASGPPATSLPRSFSPTLPSPTAAPVGADVRMVNSDSPIKVTLATEEAKSTYTAGEKAHFVMTSDTPGFLYLIAFSANDVAHCIFPSGPSADNQIRPGTPRMFTVPVTGPAGQDLIAALVSTTPLKLGDKPQYTHEEVFKIATSQAGSSPGSWQSATLLLETK